MWHRLQSVILSHNSQTEVWATTEVAADCGDNVFMVDWSYKFTAANSKICIADHH